MSYLKVAKRYLENKVDDMNKEEIGKINIKEEYIDEVCKKTNWSRDVAESNLRKATEIGMPCKRYITNECWNLSEDEMVELNEKIKKRIEKKKKYIGLVMDATGWDYETTKKNMEEALSLGLSYSSYYRRYAYTLEKNEIEDLVQVLRKYKQRRRSNDEFCIEIVSQKSGWDSEKVKLKMDAAKKMGISYFKFVSKGCWKKSEDEIRILAQFIKNDRKRIDDNKDKYVNLISEATGWTRGKCELEVWRAKANQGASYEDYCAFKFYEIPEIEQKNYVTLEDFTKMRIKYNAHDVVEKYFNDKAVFNETFSNFVKRKWLRNFNITFQEFEKFIENVKKIIVKPIAATQGIGIQTFNCEEIDKKKLYDKVISLPKSIMEEFIVQNHEIAEFCKSSVNTIRVLTLNDNGKCRFLYSVFRMGQGADVDNFHAGGIAASVNIENGVVYTDAADLEGNTYEKHPVSKKQIKGFKIPNWDKIIDKCKSITGYVEGADLIGWDFAITESGVDLIEGNPGASYIVAQIPNVKYRIGLRDVMVTPFL